MSFNIKNLWKLLLLGLCVWHFSGTQAVATVPAQNRGDKGIVIVAESAGRPTVHFRQPGNLVMQAGLPTARGNDRLEHAARAHRLSKPVQLHRQEPKTGQSRAGTASALSEFADRAGGQRLRRHGGRQGRRTTAAQFGPAHHSARADPVEHL